MRLSAETQPVRYGYFATTLKDTTLTAGVKVSPRWQSRAASIARIRDGDVIRLDANTGRLDVLVAPGEWVTRTCAQPDLSAAHVAIGRELFGFFRERVGCADRGASVFVA